MNVTKLIIVAVGGQGNILAARVLGEAAVFAGVPVRMSEFHGMAQRGGVVESMILFGDGMSTCISDGEADSLVGFEPSETIRAVKKCHAGSMVITNTSPLPPFTVALGKAKYPHVETTMEKIASRVKKLIAFDATSLALQAGSVLSLNMVMMGALAQTGTIPFEPELLRDTIRAKTKQAFVETNLKAFDLGFEAAARVTELSKLPNEPSGNIKGLSAHGLLNRRGAHVKRNQSLEEVYRKILDIISHHVSLKFLEMWYEIGEDDALKTQILTKKELSRRLEFLVAQGFLVRVVEEGITHWVLKK